MLAMTTTTVATWQPLQPSTKKDFTIGIKVLKKHCFGSAGCNVTFRIVPKYVGSASLPPDGTVSVTYQVTGDEDGPMINTFTVEDGKATYDSQETASIKKSSNKLKATVTDITYDE